MFPACASDVLVIFKALRDVLVMSWACLGDV